MGHDPIYRNFYLFNFYFLLRFPSRYYFPSFDVAVAELLARFGSNVALGTVAVLVKSRKVSRPLSQAHHRDAELAERSE